MKKIYISCYENKDEKYKRFLINQNEMSENKLFQIMESNYEAVNQAFMNKKNVVSFIKKNLMLAADVSVFLIGMETRKRRIIDWEARAALSNIGIFDKSGVLIIYLPDVTKEYGSKIPHSVLPKILRENIVKKNVYFAEETWEKLNNDLNAFDKLVSIAYFYNKMSKYDPIDIENIMMENETNYSNIT